MLASGIRDSIVRLRTAPCGTGASATHIARAEVQLGVKFPSCYREFLALVGWGGIGHYEFLGLGEDVPDFLNLVGITREERELARPAMPHYLVPILNDGAGNHYCLDLRAASEEECQVVFWDHELDETQIPGVESATFESWLRERIVDIQHALDVNSASLKDGLEE